MGLRATAMTCLCGLATLAAIAGCAKKAPATQASVTGRVKSVNGRALADVELRLTVPSGSVSKVVATAKSGDEGAFVLKELPAGTYLLRADLGGFSPASVTVNLRPGETVTSLLRLEPIQLLEGRVEDREKRPIPQAALFAWPLGGGSSKANVVESASDAEGRFALAGLAPGPWTVMVEAPGFGTLRLERVDVPSRPLVLKLEGEARSLGGQVVDGRAHVADARVVLAGPALSVPREVRSNDKGLFLFHGLGFGRFVLRAIAGDKVSRSVAVVIDEETGWLPPVRLPLADGARVTGVAIDDVGRPVPNAEIELTDSPADEAPETGRAGRDGRFLVGPVAPGKYEVWARAPGHAMAKPAEVIAHAEGAAEVSLRLARAVQITGKIVDEAGRPLAGVLVSAAAESASVQDFAVLSGKLPLAADAANLPAQALAAKGQLRSAPSDGGGRFAIADLPPGRFNVIATAETRLPVARGPLALAPGKSADLGALALPLGLPLRGRLVDEAGAPIRGVRIDVRRTDVATGGEYTAVAGEDGRFVAFVPPGHFTLVAVAPRRAPAQKAGLVVQKDQPSEEVELRLERADAVLEGTVRDPHGRPASRARILAYPLRSGVPDASATGAAAGNDLPPMAAVSADRTGRFRLTDVPRQPFLVEVRHAEWPTRTVVATPGQALFVELPRPGGIDGEVRDRTTGVFVAKYRLEAVGPDGRPAMDVRTQGAGFELRGLLPGRWRLRFSASGYAPLERVLEVPPGAARNELSLRNVRVELERAGGTASASPSNINIGGVWP
ncbi:MAG TPA: carboxypeptidase-like regulatory domain-containing protein [Polyangia bacterium]